MNPGMAKRRKKITKEHTFLGISVENYSVQMVGHFWMQFNAANHRRQKAERGMSGAL